MTNIQYVPESYGIKRLCTMALERAEKGKKLSDVASQVVKENISENQDVLNKLQLNKRESVPLDFFIHLGFGNKEVIELVIKGMLDCFRNEGHI